MTASLPPPLAAPWSRRQFLHASTLGVGSVALAWLLNEDRLLAMPTRPEQEKAQAVSGGAS